MDGRNKQQDTSTTLNKMHTGDNPKILTSKRKIIKNLLVVCFGMLLLFVAYNGLSTLQSTLNQKQGIGVASQAIIYAGFCISALLLPTYTIKKLGCKKAMLLSMSLYIPYIAANFYFTWLTMVPSAILVGLSASLMWSSQCTYFNESSVIYSKLCFSEIQEKRKLLKNYKSANYIRINGDKDLQVKQDSTAKIDVLSVTDLQVDSNVDNNDDCEVRIKKDVQKEQAISNGTQKQFETISVMLDTNLKYYHEKEDKIFSDITNQSEEYSKLVSSVTARFFGLFGLIFRQSDVWSNLISYFVLNDNTVLDNITGNINCSCGASFCNVESECFSHNLAEPTQQMRNILSGGSVLLAILAVLLVFLFLDDVQKDNEPVEFTFTLAMATCKFIRRKEALLLFPLSSYIGLQQGFYIGDFTKSYIACAWGVYHVGLVTICYGIFAGISATLAGLVVKYTGRIPVMIVGAVVNATICIYLLIWNPVPDQPSKFFISAAMWGVAIGILWSQLRAFYGVIFKEDEAAAFAGFYLWDSIGYCTAFSYSNYICTYLKIYILLLVSTLGMIGYLKTESIHIRRQKESRIER